MCIVIAMVTDDEWSCVKHPIRELYLKLVQGLPRAAPNLLLTGLNRPSSDEGQPFLQMRDGSDSYRIWVGISSHMGMAF